MAEIMVEVLKRKQLSTGMGILVVLLIAMAMLIFVFMVSFLQFVLKINWPQFIAYAIVILVGIYIVKNYLTEYIYEIRGDRVVFYRKIGSREKELLSVPKRDIFKCGEYATIDTKKRKVFKYTYLKKETAFAIDFKLFVVLVSVSDEFKKSLRGKK